MKVCIIGTGRSGTKALYYLLQELMLQNHDHVDFCYEPFLWDKDVFNGRFQDVKHAFGKMDSLSVEGIYNHQKLPLFIDDPKPYESNSYLTDLLQPHDVGSNILLKFIRANGRIKLLSKICPDLKFIFIIRNPLDSMNSVMSRFSYFGGEYHHDDWPRFLHEINARYKLNICHDNLPSLIERELLFWYYMNRFALETFEQNKVGSLNICHESYLDEPEKNLNNICKHLGYQIKEEYLEKIRTKIGDLTKTRKISEAELSLILPYWDKYVSLLKEFNIEHCINKETALNRYIVSPVQPMKTRKYYGFTPAKIIKELEKEQIKNAELTLLLEKIKTNPGAF